MTANEYTARDISLWDKVKEKLTENDLSTHVRIITRDVDFVNYQLSQGQYFFTEICQQGIILYDSGRFHLNSKDKLSKQQGQPQSETGDYWAAMMAGWINQKQQEALEYRSRR